MRYENFYRRHRLLVSAALSVAVVACATERGAAEDIIQSSVMNRSLSVTIVSTGCTRPQDLDFVIERPSRGNEAIVTVVRVKPDLCRAMPKPVTFRYKLADIGIHRGEDVRVANEITRIGSIVRN